MMLLAAGYFDESSDNEAEERCFTVGGFVSSGAPSLVLDLRWKELIDKYQVKYFKTSELENMFGEFKKYRDDPDCYPLKRFSAREKDLIRQIKTEFVDLIVEQKEAFWAVSATVLIRDWNLLKHESPEIIARLPPFYQLCGHLVMLEAGMLIWETNDHRRHDPALLRPIFDSHDEYSKRFIFSFDVFAKKNPNCSRYLLPPLFESDESYLMLQAADLFVYEMRRTIGSFHYDKREILRKSMERLLPQVSRTFILDRDALVKMVEMQSDYNPIQSLEKEALAVVPGFS